MKSQEETEENDVLLVTEYHSLEMYHKYFPQVCCLHFNCIYVLFLQKNFTLILE